MREGTRQYYLLFLIVALGLVVCMVLIKDGVMFDDYVLPKTCLGYRLNERISDTSENIIKITRQDKLSLDLYEMKCTEDFGGIDFETCTLGVSRRTGVMVISAQRHGGPEMFKIAVRRMSKLFGRPVCKKKDFVSWNYSGGEIILRCDHPDVVYDKINNRHVNYFNIVLVFMNPSLARR